MSTNDKLTIGRIETQIPTKQEAIMADEIRNLKQDVANLNIRIDSVFEELKAMKDYFDDKSLNPEEF